MKTEIEKMPSVSGVRHLRQMRQMLDYALPFTGLSAQQPGTVRFIIVTPARMCALNMLHLGHEGPTDVITYDLRQEGDFLSGVFGEEPLLAEIYLCPEVARQYAAKFGTTPAYELFLYAVHGLLHLGGEDDLTDEARASMRAAEKRVLTEVTNRFGLPDFLH